MKPFTRSLTCLTGVLCLSTAATAAPPDYTVNADAAPGALIITGYAHNQLDKGLTPAYGYYQTIFPSMNDLGLVAATLPPSAEYIPPAPIHQARRSSDGRVAAIWENGVATRLSESFSGQVNQPEQGVVTEDGRVIVEVRGCRDDDYNGWSNSSTCSNRVTAINNDGIAVGSAHDWPFMGSPYFEKPYKWTHTVNSKAYKFPSYVISSVAWSQVTNPTDINEIGTVVGTGITEGGAGPQDGLEHGLYSGVGLYGWVGVTHQRTRAHAVNESNNITGAAYYDPDEVYNGSVKSWRAYYWSNEVLNWIGTLPGGDTSEGYDINDGNVIVGLAENDQGQDVAFRWDAAAGMQALGGLGGSTSVARSINNAGVIVGSATTANEARTAFIYVDGQMYDLNQYAAAPAGWVMEDAYTVNENGQILVRARNTTDGSGAYWILNPPAQDQGGTTATAHRISLNSSTDAAIESAADVDMFKFVVAHDGTMTLASDGMTDVKAELYDAEGVLIAANDNYMSANFSISEYLAAGSYYLSVSHAAGGSGAYTLNSAMNPDEGDSREVPTIVELNSNYSANMEAYDDVDMYRLYVPAQGILTLSSSGLTDVKATLLNVAGGTIASGDNEDGIYFNISETIGAGIYYLQVEYAAGDMGGYAIHNQFEALPLEPDDFGNTIETATAVALESNTAARINYYGDADFFSVTINETGNLAVSVSRSMAAYVALYDAAGALLKDGYNDNSGDIVRFGAAVGTYYIKVKHKNPLGMEDYSLYVDLDLESNSSGAATPIALGSTTSGGIDYLGYYSGSGNWRTYYTDADYFTFDVASAGWVTIKSEGPLDVSGTLSGNGVSYSMDDYKGDTNFQITANLQPGSYYAVVGSKQVIGHYNLTTSYDTQPPADPAGNDIASAQAISQTDNVDAYIDYVGDTDVYRVDLAESAYLKVNSSGSNRLRVRILDAAGATLKTATVGNVLGDQLSAGTYYLEVYNTQSTVLNYTLDYDVLVDVHGGSTATATVLTPGVAVNGSVYPGDYDYFSVTVAEAGLLTIKTLAAEVAIEGRTGGYQYIDDGADKNAYFNKVVSAGTHTFYLHSSGAGSYQVLTEFSTTVPTDDSDNQFINALQLTDAVTATGQFELSYDADTYRIDASGQGLLSVDVDGQSEVKISIYDAQGNFLTTNKTSGWGYVNYGIASWGTFEAGTFYIRVTKEDSLVGDFDITASVLTLQPDDFANVPEDAETAIHGLEYVAYRSFNGDVDYLRIEVPQTSYLFVPVTAVGDYGGAPKKVTLHDADGVQLDELAYSEYAFRRWAEPGVYYLRMTGKDISRYHARVYITDIAANEQLIAPDSTTPDAINEAGESRVYKMVLPESGILIQKSTGTTDVVSQLYDASGTLIQTVGESTTNFSSAQVLQPGTYYRIVYHKSRSSTGSYQLESTFKPAVDIAPTSQTAGAISPIGDQDYYRITVVEDGRLTIQTTGSTDTEGYLYDSLGNLIVSNSSSGEGSNFLIQSDLTVGSYYVRVLERYGDSEGDYLLDSLFETGIVPDAGGSTSTAMVIEANTSVQGAIDPAGDKDYYKIVLTEMGVLTAYTTGSTNTYGRLRDSYGSIITNNNDSGEGSNFHISRTLTAGTYYIEVLHYYTSGTGDYELHTEFGVAPPEAGNTIAEAMTIDKNSATAEAIDYGGDYDYYKVVLDAPGTLTAYTSSSIDTYGNLYDANGNSITYNDDSGTGYNFRFVRTLAAGTYYIRVRHYSSVGTGSYTLYTSFTP